MPIKVNILPFEKLLEEKLMEENLCSNTSETYILDALTKRRT